MSPRSSPSCACTGGGCTPPAHTVQYSTVQVGQHTACIAEHGLNRYWVGARGQQTQILEEKGKILERKGKKQRKGAKSREYIGRATPLNEAIDQCLVLS